MFIIQKNSILGVTSFDLMYTLVKIVHTYCAAVNSFGAVQKVSVVTVFASVMHAFAVCVFAWLA